MVDQTLETKRRSIASKKGWRWRRYWEGFEAGQREALPRHNAQLEAAYAAGKLAEAKAHSRGFAQGVQAIEKGYVTNDPAPMEEPVVH